MMKRMMVVAVFWVAMIGAWMVVRPARVSALENGVARTPPMGWNSWNKFGCNVSEDLIKGMADAMVQSGMKDAGYQYVVIDDCWQVSRDAQGNIVADPKTFPSGIKALADYVHGKGLKFGLYSDAGWKTCAGRPGSMGHEFQDAAQYAAWGVDYLKYDWCNTDTTNAQAAYTLMSRALVATGRPIVFSMCEWGTAKPWLWAKDVGNLWRTTSDISSAEPALSPLRVWNMASTVPVSSTVSDTLKMRRGRRARPWAAASAHALPLHATRITHSGNWPRCSNAPNR